MAWRARKKTREPVSPPYGEPTPSYLRARFVISVVALAAVLALLVTRVGPARAAQSSGRAADERPAVDVGAGTTPRSTNPDDCPKPGTSAPIDAAELLTVFMAAVADPAVGQLPASAEVQRQVEATAPSPPLTRMTRVRGFAGQAGTWSTCVVSYWMGARGPMQSLDVVTVTAVRGAGSGEVGSSDDRDDDSGDSNDDSERSRTDELGEHWEVSRWLRGEPRPTERSRVAALSFFNGSGCSRPDRQVSVAIPEGSPQSRLRSALEELISGSVGRSPTVSSSVPLDIQVLDASVDGTSVRVVLTKTYDDSMNRCEGTAAYEQVVETATAIAAESLIPDGEGDLPEVHVDVVVDGRSVDTLRP